MSTVYDMEEEFEHKGYKFTLLVEHDDNMVAPWDEHDSHGPVSGWTTRDKAPGEWVLSGDGHRAKRFYDFAEAIKIAKRDGWDTPPYKQGTPGERAARAAKADFEYLRRWCNDDWWWVVVTVKDQNGETRDLGGLSSDDEECIRQEVAIELADELITDLEKEHKQAALARKNQFADELIAGLEEKHKQAVLTRKNQLDELEAIVRNHGMEGIMAAERRERFDNFLTNHFGPAVKT